MTSWISRDIPSTSPSSLPSLLRCSVPSVNSVPSVLNRRPAEDDAGDGMGVLRVRGVVFGQVFNTEITEITEITEHNKNRDSDLRPSQAVPQSALEDPRVRKRGDRFYDLVDLS